MRSRCTVSSSCPKDTRRPAGPSIQFNRLPPKARGVRFGVSPGFLTTNMTCPISDPHFAPSNRQGVIVGRPFQKRAAINVKGVGGRPESMLHAESPDSQRIVARIARRRSHDDDESDSASARPLVAAHRILLSHRMRMSFGIGHVGSGLTPSPLPPSQGCPPVAAQGGTAKRRSAGSDRCRFR